MAFKTKLLNHIFTGALALSFLLVGIYITLVVTEKPPIHYEGGLTKVDPKVYAVGEAITVSTVRCADYDLVFSVARKYVEIDTGREYPIDPIVSNVANKGCHEIHYAAVPQAVRMDPGHYRLESVISVPSKFRPYSFSIKQDTQDFYVVTYKKDKESALQRITDGQSPFEPVRQMGESQTPSQTIINNTQSVPAGQSAQPANPQPTQPQPTQTQQPPLIPPIVIPTICVAGKCL